MNYRRSFLLQGACTAAGLAAARALAQPAEQPSRGASIRGSEHWTTKKTDAGDVRLFMWRKRTDDVPKGTILSRATIRDERPYGRGSFRRRGAGPRYLRAGWHLYRHVAESAGARPGAHYRTNTLVRIA